MAIGLGRLRLSTDDFWALSPREFAAFAGFLDRQGKAMERGDLEALMRRMDMDEDDLDFSVTLDATAAAEVLADLEARSERFGRALTGALAGAVHGGKSLEETLRTVGLRLTDMALSAGLKLMRTSRMWPQRHPGRARRRHPRAR
eukprot:gene58207-79717_t